MIDTRKTVPCLATSSLVKPVNDQLPASEPASATFTCSACSFYLSISMSKLP